MDLIISDLQFEAARDLADQTLTRFSNVKGHYNNTLNSHLRGKIGEIAVASMFETLGYGVDLLYADLDKMALADIVISGKTRVEIKTWSLEYWIDMGRCIAVDQLSKLQKKCDCIMWCVSTEKMAPGMQVKINGWNYMSDVSTAPRRLTGPSNGRKVENYQIEIDEVRGTDEFRKYLNSLEHRT